MIMQDEDNIGIHLKVLLRMMFIDTFNLHQAHLLLIMIIIHGEILVQMLCLTALGMLIIESKKWVFQLHFLIGVMQVNDGLIMQVMDEFLNTMEIGNLVILLYGMDMSRLLNQMVKFQNLFLRMEDLGIH